MIALITACAGRTPRPVDAMKVTDKEMTCEQIQNELLLANNEINRLSLDADKTAKNVAFGCGRMVSNHSMVFHGSKKRRKNRNGSV